MDLNLMEKLRILKIDTELRPEIKMKPMSRYYFVTSTNPGEQFFVFASTAAWLIRKTGKDFEQPHEEDDPNAIIANIIDILREKGIVVDFSSHKLKQGYGEQVSHILNLLADDVLKHIHYEWEKPIVDFPETEEDTADDTDQVEDETEIVLDKVEEEMAIYSEDSEEEKENHDDSDVKDNITNKIHDWEAWKLELERVAPALRIKIPADGRDWRARHAQMKAYRDELIERFQTTGSQLNKLYTNINSTMDKISARENILNEQFEPQVREYGALLEELNKANNEYKEVSAGVAEQQEMLNEITAKVESVKQKTETRGSTMNDNTQLVNVKKSLANLKKEISDMDFQILILLWLITTKENPNSNNLLGDLENKMISSEAFS